MSLLRLRPAERISFSVSRGPACGVHSNAGSCMDAPVHASSSSSGFERVIGCGHVSGLFCGPSTTAGRYGATRAWCKSVLRARGSLTRMHSQIHSHRSLSLPFADLLTRRRSVLTLAQHLSTLQAERNPCNLRSWSSLPRWIEPFCWRGRSRRACEVCAPAFVPATSSRVEPSGMPIE